jgi:gas vesicle structural protein
MSQNLRQQIEPTQAPERLSELGRPLGLFDLIDRILDKGLVIDAYVSVTIVGIELLVIRARIVVASIETFLRYAAAMGLYGEPGGTIQRAEREERQIRQPQQQQQQPQQQQQGPQQLQQLLQQLQQPLAQLTQPLQQRQQQPQQQ